MTKTKKTKKEKNIKGIIDFKTRDEAFKELGPKFNYKNIMQVPVIEKVVVNCGIGKILGNIDPSKRQKTVSEISEALALICGQYPQKTSAKKSISSFGVRKGDVIGLKATLRGRRMQDFLIRLINLALPRTRDFKGILLKSIDAKGNLTIGIKEHIIFPEVNPEKPPFIFGLEVTVVMKNIHRKGEAIEFYKFLGFPIK